jgi:S1-C subfamily serine protease
MKEYMKTAQNIPWGSRGRMTPASKVGKCLVPIGVFNYAVPEFTPDAFSEAIDNTHPDYLKHMMSIMGTGIKVGDAKIITCTHVIDGIKEENKPGYVMFHYENGNTIYQSKYRYTRTVEYIDPRSAAYNKSVDLSLIPLPVQKSEFLPEEPPSIEWGNSADLGVGDPVVLGGYPYGTELFTMTKTNRDFIQPSFYPGIISRIIPASSKDEIRILHISTGVAGGMSGGAVFDPQSGKLLGMIYASVEGRSGDLHPVTYAIPSEVMAPFSKAINFDTEQGRRGKEA